MFLPPIIKPVLYLPAKFYELGVRLRISCYERGIFKRHRLATPVISVGNLTVGGTGKTPCTAALAQMLRDEGLEVAILSRGYKRTTEGRIEVSDGQEILCESHEAGDEPYLLARACPGVRVVADRDRWAAGRWLEERAKPSVFLLDDGYQHLRLARDLDLALIDGTDDLSKAEMVPFGRLREPLAGLARANAVVVTGSNRPFDRNQLETTIRRYARSGVPIVYAHSLIMSMLDLNSGQSQAAEAFAGKRMAAFAGIARPERLINDLESLGIPIVLRRDFEDHHRYTREEITELAVAAKQAGADGLITTEKDAANIPIEMIAMLGLPCFVARIEFHWERPAEIRTLAFDALRKKDE
jgi:tetraacyldisaccharide 4'-kinase